MKKIAAHATADSQTQSLQDWEPLWLGVHLYWLSQWLTDGVAIKRRAMRQIVAQLNGMVSQISKANSGYILDLFLFSRICPK
jgi:hypothetical protein